MSNIFSGISDFFNPKKNITYYPFAQNKVVTTTTGNTAGNVGTVQASAPKTTPRTNQNIFTPVATNTGMTYGPPAPTKTSTTPSQPTNTQSTYDTNYQNYLKGRTGTATTLAEQNAATAAKNAQDNYDLQKAGLNEQVSGLKSSLDSYKGNRAADVAAYNDVTARNKENAQTASGNSQRKLMEARRQQAGQTEKTYAGLGTIDSYGTGSFTQQNANDDTAFLRMTNENFKTLDDQLYKLDTDAQAYKRSSDEKVQGEESKFNDAVLQINNLLKGNELLRTQAIQAAQDALAQKKAEINDEYQGLILQNEQDRVNAQKAIDVETAKGQEIKQAYAQTSPEFQSSGKVTNMNDMMFVNKYKDAYEAIMKNGGISSTSNNAINEVKDTISLIDQISGGDTSWNTGFLGAYGPKIAGTSGYDMQRKIAQLKSQLQLASVGKLKGQGQVSDAERKILADASTQIDPGMSQEAFNQELAKVKMVLERNNGLQSTSNTGGQTIRVQDKQTGQYGFISPNEFDPNKYIQA